ncbi:Alcohol dehydrogenase, class IV [Desulfacinum hydrothermale DSM 13146]|uniref:Alcohol dehydrogenase, class IV n=1 Tax=Desulfacinum hydrothermale DSM 13146 TaxID=1121390 RepID=A0A1W1XU14_9BACT|nr:iron-containing alcohol dehydrogenase [Desulfacinum hydrothermale]SMC26998.1 Alcohol dehydrogenase, class IV [Desulfacinum hydrothermale DSM 13146]
MEITKFSIPEIIFGRGALKYAGLCAKRLGAEKPMVVSDPGLHECGWVSHLLEVLAGEGLEWCYFEDVVSNPRDTQVAHGALFYAEHKADVIIALGGGSPMDAAKGIAVVASNGGSIQDYEGANRIHRPLPPMVFLPSTAGSGSDISQFAIITDTRRRLKMTIVSRTLVPNISIIDPNVLTTKPRYLVLAAAVDALAHAIESYVSIIASPFTELQSLKAIEMISIHLPRAAQEPTLEILESLSIASTAAGMAFSNASLGADHALAHSLGGMFDILHGEVHSVLLPAVMRFNMDAALPKMAQIGKILIGKNLRSERQTAQAGIEALEHLFASLGMKQCLRDLVPEPSHLPQLCRMAAQDACLLTNPRPAKWDDLLAICEEAW